MLIRARAVAKRHRSGVAFTLKRDLTTRLKERLPWELTGDQQRALREIVGDMTAPDRMHRLLMGDVGTGKTVVALFAMLLAIENDFQAALMAPTELLAEQHGATLERLLEPLQLKPELLLGRQTPAEKAAVRKRLAGGQARLAVGTHALLQEGVSVPAAGTGGHRRAAPLRRGAASGADRQGGGTRCPASHRHSDPALAGADPVWGSGRLDLTGAASGSRDRADGSAAQQAA